MNYYSFHIGDFDKATRHLTRMERSVYRDLLDLYYDTEQPLTLDFQALCRRIIARSNEESTCVEQVLNEFFTKTDDGWRHSRCDEEIAAYHANTSKRAMAGRASAEAKRQKKAENLNTCSTHVEQTLNTCSQPLQHTVNKIQLTNNQEPITSNQEEDTYVASKLPTCPTNEIIRHYHETLPELPKVRMLSDPRKRAIAAFWQWVLTSKRIDGAQRAQTTDQALTWIRAYFDRARSNDFLMGRNERSGEHASWRCDLDFLLSEKGKRHVIEKTEVAA